MWLVCPIYIYKPYSYKHTWNTRITTSNEINYSKIYLSVLVATSGAINAMGKPQVVYIERQTATRLTNSMRLTDYIYGSSSLSYTKPESIL